MRHLVLPSAVFGMVLISGCTSESDKPPPPPMPTDGPNQVVIYVPAMV